MLTVSNAGALVAGAPITQKGESMNKVKILSDCIATPGVRAYVGEVIEVSEDYARALVLIGRAEAMPDDAKLVSKQPKKPTEKSAEK